MAWLGLERGTLRRDVALAGLSLTGGLLLLALGVVRTLQPATGTATWWFLPPLLLVSAAVAVRRVASRTSLGVGTAAVVADLVIGGSLGTVLIYTQVVYDACVYGPARLWRWVLRAGVGLSVLAGVAGAVALRSWQGIGFAVPAVLVLVLPALTGISVRYYRDQATAERDRAEQTARMAELDRQRAVTAERNRMARDLHDVVANHLSAVALHATAALAVADRDPDAVHRSLGVIRQSGVQGLAELRRMIDILRDPAGESPVEVRLVEADRLVDRARAAGLTVRLRTTGEPRALPAGVDQAAYRILQESLTNALKHGGGEVDVALGWDADRVRLTVRNPLPVGRTQVPVPGAGAGLVGMRERVALLRGRLEAGVEAGGWRVHAELPLRVPA